MTPKIVVSRSLRKGLGLFDADRFAWLDRAAELGPLVRLRIGAVSTWVVTDPGLALQVLLKSSGVWRRPLSFGVPTRLAIGGNLFTLDDRQWNALASDVVPTVRASTLDDRRQRAEEIVAEEVGAWPTGKWMDLDRSTSRLVLRMATFVLFGHDLGADQADETVEHQQAMIARLGAQISRPNAIIPVAFGKAGKRMTAHREGFDRGIQETFDALGRSGHSRGVLGALNP